MTVAAKKICILSGNHLCHNPRVLKEATALARAGYEVEVLGACFDPSLKTRDRDLMSRLPFEFTPVIDFTKKSFLAKKVRLQCRVRSKVGQLAYSFVGLPNRWQLGYAVNALGRVARRRNADIYIAHSEASLYVAKGLLRSGCRIGVDMEDWFSEDLLPEARKLRPVSMLRDLERGLLREAAYTTCPSQAMSRALAQEYGCSPPAVIYNVFPWSDRESLDGLMRDRRDRRIPSIHWFSQTLGEGRGLEDLLAALPHLKCEADIHLRGNLAAGFDGWLTARIPEHWRARIFVHALVPNEDLLSRIAEHDIGFAGEMKYCRSRDLTVTNKVLQYLLAGLAVVASDTAGQSEVAKQTPDAVVLYPSGNANALAETLDRFLESPGLMNHAKTAALMAAETRFCWEGQKQALVQNVELALA